MSGDQHSLKCHPLREFMTDAEFQQMANDVQFGRISWPICWTPIDRCEHGVPDGEWCKQCSADYKAARIENGDE